jgi:hypothetical protein
MPDWRSETAPLNQLERQGFAWEFLRRNQEYRTGYERIMGAGNDNKPELANAAANFARHWGLICTAGPETAGDRGNRAMAPGNCADRRHSYIRAGGLRDGGIARPGRLGGGNHRIGRR